ncbi:MAG: hypothetical protein QOI91_2493 [Solirubrobacteraceae bacterium]|nr:hypothetical protein [Solirubrobacteraceae bacterium]
MRNVRGTIAVALGLMGLAAAPASAYDEMDNLAQAWGQTQKDFGDPQVTGATIVNSATNAVANLQDPDAPRQGPYQLHQWPWSGDPKREAWDGRRQDVTLTCGTGKLAASVSAPRTGELKVNGRAPGVVINEGFQGNQKMYAWATQGLADAGYVVMIYDSPGQGHSDQSVSCPGGTLKAAVDWFRSGANPFASELDVDRIGTAGHSAGAGAVQSLGDYNGIVKAISAWSSLSGTYAGNAPIQGQGADYDTWIAPPTPTSADGPDSAGKLPAFEALRQRNPGLDVQQVIIESATHLAWSHVTWSYTSVWSEEVALHYALAWFDRYLANDHARGGLTATQRIKGNYAAHDYARAYDVQEDWAGADKETHGLSKKYLSAYAIGGDVCRNQRLGC